MTVVLRTSLRVRTLLFTQRPNKDDLSALTAIWIFGIFTLAGLHRTQFWDTLSRKLKQRGQDYVERCTIRMESQSINDVVLPSQFPPLPELDEGTPSFVGEEDIKEEDLKEVSDTLLGFGRNG